MSFHELNLLLQSIFQSNVIGIHARDVLAASKCATPIQGANQTGMSFVVNPYSVVAALVGIKFRSRAVSRSVVNDDELEITKVLIENALNGLGEKALAVEYAHHD